MGANQLLKRALGDSLIICPPLAFALRFVCKRMIYWSGLFLATLYLDARLAYTHTHKAIADCVLCAQVAKQQNRIRKDSD